MDEALKYQGILKKMNVDEQIQMIGKIGSSTEEIETLLELLADPVYEFRIAAFDNLKSRVTPILEQVVRTCSSANADQRYWAMRLLIESGEENVSAVEICARNVEFSLQRLAVEALGNWQKKSSIGVLIDLLGSSDWQLRQHVFKALEGYGAVILEPLTKVLVTDNEDLFYWGLRLLGKLGHKSRKSLVKLLSEAPPHRKRLILSALAECGDRESLTILLDSLSGSGLMAKRSSEAILRVGDRALDTMEHRLPSVPVDQLYWYFRTMLKMGASGLSSLERFLCSQTEDYLWEAQDCFEKLGEEGISLLESLTRSERKEVRLAAYQSLADLDSKLAYPIIAKGISDKAWICKKLCADALIRCGDDVVTYLRGFLNSSDSEEVFWLIYIFKQSGDGRRHIVEFLRRADKEIAAEAASSLRMCVPEEAIVPLLNCLRSEFWIVRKEAAETLRTAGVTGLQKIVESLAIQDSELQFWISKILRSYPASTHPHLSTLLYQNDRNVELAARAMGIIRNPVFTYHLREILSSTDPCVRLAACWALLQINPGEELKPVFGLLAELEVREHPLLLECVKLQSIAARSIVLEGLDSANHKLIRNSIYLCGQLELHESVRKLQSIIEEESNYAVLACEAFLSLKDRSIVPFLKRMLGSNLQDEIHTSILSILGMLSEQDVIPSILDILSHDLSEPKRQLYYQCVFKMGVEAIPPLIQSLDDEEPMKRKLSAQLLLEFGALAVGYLKKSQHSSETNVRYWSTKILKQYFQDES